MVLYAANHMISMTLSRTFGNAFETEALIIGLYIWHRISPQDKVLLDWNVVKVTVLTVVSAIIRSSSALSWLPMIVSMSLLMISSLGIHGILCTWRLFEVFRRWAALWITGASVQHHCRLILLRTPRSHLLQFC